MVEEAKRSREADMEVDKITMEDIITTKITILVKVMDRIILIATEVKTMLVPHRHRSVVIRINTTSLPKGHL